MSLGAKGGGSSGSQTVTTEPPAFQKPYLEQILGEAQQLYEGGPPQYFPHSTVVPYSPAEVGAQQGVLNYAAGAATDTTGRALGAQNFLLGDVLNPASNPYLQSAARGAVDPIFDRLMSDVLPSIRSGARADGQQGSSRQGIAEGLAIDRATENALNATSSLYSQGYGQGLEALTRGLTLAPVTVGQTGILPAQLAAGVGEAQRGYGEQLLQDAINRWNYQQQAPYVGLQEYASLAGSPLGSTQTSGSGGGGGSGWGQVLGSTAQGAGAGAMFGPWGALIGGAVGLGSGLLNKYL